MKVAFYTLGCKVNQYETELMNEAFERNGYITVSTDDNPDVIVINSCTVTAESDRKSRQQIRHFKKAYPNAVIAVTGCMPQADPECYKKIPQADIIIGNRNHAHLPECVEQFMTHHEQIVKIAPHDIQSGEQIDVSAIRNFHEHTRAFVKIEDGCNRFCSYCIIPYARGRVRSKQITYIIQEIDSLYKNGYAEIVLVGINLSAFGTDTGEDLPTLLKKIYEVYPTLRIRLGSLEADLLTPDMISEMSKCKNLCPHFHLSLQSGCDRTLKAMNRKYDSVDFAALIESIRRSFSNPAITTDVIVGFAGETDEDFNKSAEFVKSIGFAKVHIFPYSVRPGTRAEKFDGQVSKAVKTKRAKMMSEAAADGEHTFLQSQIGTLQKVLLERPSNDFWVGYSENYTEIFVENALPEDQGTIVTVIPERISDGRIYGRITDK